MEYVDYIDYREKVFGVGLDFSDLYFKKDGKKYLLYDYEFMKKRFELLHKYESMGRNYSEYGVKIDIFCIVTRYLNKIYSEIRDDNIKNIDNIKREICSNVAKFLVRNGLDFFYSEDFCNEYSIYSNNYVEYYNFLLLNSSEIRKNAILYRTAFRLKDEFKNKKISNSDKNYIKEEMMKAKIIADEVVWLSNIGEFCNSYDLLKYEKIPASKYLKIEELMRKKDECNDQNKKIEFRYEIDTEFKKILRKNKKLIK